jgi:hypothetical protein
LNEELWIETKKYKIKIEKIPDQSGLKNVIQHTYYLKKDKNGTSDKSEKQR